MEYVASHEEAVLTYNASNIILAVHSDASYNSNTKSQSRAGVNFFMSNNYEFPTNNVAVLNIAKIIKTFMTSATKT